jgi:hypothetical protein
METFLVEHLLSDWSILRTVLDRTVDDVVLLMHLVLLSAGASTHTEDQPVSPENFQMPEVDPEIGFTVLRTSQSRAAAERVWNNLHLSRYIEATDTAQVLQDAVKRLTEGEDAGGAFTAQLKETYDSSALAPKERHDTVPALWRFKRYVDARIETPNCNTYSAY